MITQDIIADAAVNWPDRVAVIADDGRRTYGELFDDIEALGAGLEGLVSPGGVVAILSRNSVAYVTALFGVPGRGAVLAMINYRLNPREWCWILAESGAECLLIEDALVDDFLKARQGGDALKSIIVLGEAIGGLTPFAEILDQGRLAPLPTNARRPSPDAPAHLIYTSGTTGFPKGAVVTHANVLAGVDVLITELDIARFATLLMSYPLCHSSAFMATAFLARSAQVVLPIAFDPGRWLELIARYRVDYSSLAPTMANFVLSHPDWATADISSLKMLGYGGASMPADYLRRFAERASVRFYAGWGQSETTLMPTFLSPDDHQRGLDGDEKILTSVGRAATHCAIRIVDDDFADVGVNAVGELCVRTPMVMKGYWNNPEATAATFRDGWLLTGDLARRDDEDFIYIVDRKREMIKSGGQNIYPREVERVLSGHEAVEDAAVLGLPDETWGEIVVAAVILKPGRPVCAADLSGHCAAELAGYKRPKVFVRMTAFPKNVTGKIAKRDLRSPVAEMIAAGQTLA